MNAALERQEASLSAIHAFLPCATPDAWVECAVLPENRATLLVDHANCEKKAAATALSLMHRYIHDTTLLEKMSKLAREELRHFEQVLKIMRKQSVEYVPLRAYVTITSHLVTTSSASHPQFNTASPPIHAEFAINIPSVRYPLAATPPQQKTN